MTSPLSLLQTQRAQLSVSPKEDTPSPWPALWPFAGPSPVALCPSCTGEPTTGHGTPDWPHQV